MLHKSKHWKKKLSRPHLFWLLAVQAHLAAVLTEPLSKLQSEAGLWLLGYSLEKVVKRKKRDPNLADMENAEITFDKYIVETLFLYLCFSVNMLDKKASSMSLWSHFVHAAI